MESSADVPGGNVKMTKRGYCLCLFAFWHPQHSNSMETGLLSEAKNMISYLARGVEFAAALIIAIAALEATIKSLTLFIQRSAPPERKNEVRLTLGRWLAVALEFELAADILNTAVMPTWQDIGKLAAIAALRTSLNYFLEREIQQESRPQKRHAEQITMGAHAASRQS